ncbi:polymorphic toxin-type HINT domain-containing protein [Micromonospora chokoriensis]|uniref:Hint domain-containing protein n=1 Tax=Micromonospora chokoriensis TaxID=356851 RepID=A0A1C4UM50_9ACTN|nr:polymorphic toxin-type HINT domain-containing protein [Micromonospora chokoriensis]SCE72701.1 Short repeat-containing protein of unknown function [Micromonospora chokoriensis]
MLAVIILPIFAGSSPAEAEEPVPATVERGQVVTAWLTGGEQVRAAAEQALLGTDEQVRAFLAAEWQDRQTVDDRLAVNQMMAAGGSALRTVATAALDSEAPGAISTFLSSGWQQAADTDQRVRVNQMMAGGGTKLRQAAQAALDADSSTAIDAFLASGWQAPYESDLRLKVNQIMNAGGPRVREAATRALDADTTEALIQFLSSGWATAAARDQELTAITDLTKAAVAASEEATRETEAATEQADRAARAADAARRDAEAAREAGQRAAGNAAAAAAAAKQAATAATNAAKSAREAIGASAAASSAARKASSAAARAASAATLAQQSSARAYRSASAAARDRTKAGEAKAAALAASNASIAAKDIAVAAAKAADAALRAGDAVKAALSAGNNAALAADAAKAAAGHASAAGADASAASKAAATARANADRAGRAARAATAYAATAARAAYAARDAANRAAEDAEAAARAANDAADHAREGAEAARLATLHANAASAAAQTAVDAAVKAKEVYDAARAVDVERIAVATDQGKDVARAALVAQEEFDRQAEWNDEQAEKRGAETNQLIALAASPTTDPVVAAAAARKVALRLGQADSAWTSAAAQEALGGTDTEVIEFVRTGIPAAAAQDNRETLSDMMAVGTPALVQAAEAALASSDAAVSQLLQTRNYPGRELEDRLAVNQILAAAKQSNSTQLIKAAEAALDSADPQALRGFLDVGQHTAAAIDERLKVNQVLASPESGPEVRAAAEIALEGPPAFLKEFLNSDQYTAAERDFDAAVHENEVLALLEHAQAAAKKATEQALKAQEEAARAWGHAAEAEEYAQQANAAANAAAVHAGQAAASAQAAETSARKAATSAKTARDAAASARNSADRATRAAASAQSSFRAANKYASDAYRSARYAYEQALEARQDGETALDAAKRAATAFNERIEQMRKAAEDQIKKSQESQSRENARKLFECEGYRNLGLTDEWMTCSRNVLATEEELVKKLYWNADQCKFVFRSTTSDAYRTCLSTVLDGDFELGVAWQFAKPWVDLFTAVLGTANVGLQFACSGICGIFALGIESYYMGAPGSPAEWIDQFLKTPFDTVKRLRALSQLEKSLVQQRSEQSALSRIAERLNGCVTDSNSFIGSTKVLLPGGRSKAIKDVAVGERVVATNPATGLTGDYPVTGVIVGSGLKQLVDVKVDTDGARGGAAAEISATDNHPFYLPDSSFWANAGGLGSDKRLLSNDGSRVGIVGVSRRAEETRVYNLTVAVQQTFYVLAGSTPVLVHNSGACPRFWMDLNDLRHHYMSRNPQTGKMHAFDFGIDANFNNLNGQRFLSVIKEFVKAPGTISFPGTFRGKPCIHYVDPSTGLHVSMGTQGAERGMYLAGWKSPIDSDQFLYLMRDGVL